jgi:hypothetical protein
MSDQDQSSWQVDKSILVIYRRFMAFGYNFAASEILQCEEGQISAPCRLPMPFKLIFVGDFSPLGLQFLMRYPSNAHKWDT